MRTSKSKPKQEFNRKNALLVWCSNLLLTTAVFLRITPRYVVVYWSVCLLGKPCVRPPPSPNQQSPPLPSPLHPPNPNRIPRPISSLSQRARHGDRREHVRAAHQRDGDPWELPGGVRPCQGHGQPGRAAPAQVKTYRVLVEVYGMWCCEDQGESSAYLVEGTVNLGISNRGSEN